MLRLMLIFFVLTYLHYILPQLVHFVNRDSLGLANDFLSLGFLPEGIDVHSVSDALNASFRDELRLSQDFQVLIIGSPYLKIVSGNYEVVMCNVMLIKSYFREKNIIHVPW